MVKYAIICLALITSAGCLSRDEVKAYTWLNNTNAINNLCIKNPELKDYGFYRKLNDGNLEFISFCNPLAQKMIAIIDSDLENILDQLLPKEK